MPAYRLDSFATQMVWTEAIRAEEAERVLLDARQAARLAMDADLLMDEWELRVPSGADTDEYKGFACWRLRYREALAELDAEDANQGYARVLDALGQGRLATPQRLVLAGFTEVSPRFARLLDAFAAQGSDIGQWRDAQRARAAASLRGPGSGQRVARRREVGPRRNCRSIRQVATPSSRRNWKPNPCSPGACWARRWPAATARPRWRSTWPWAGHWMNGRWRARAAAWLRAGRMRGRQGCGVQTLAPRCWPAIAPAMCAAFAPVRHRRALAARCPPARQRAGMAQAALDDAGIGAGLEPGHGHLDARRPQGQLRRMDAAHEGGPDGAGLSGRSRAGQRGLSGDGRAGRGAGQFLGAGAGGGKLGGQAAVRLLESVARTATFQPQRDRRRGWTCWACWRPRAVIGMGSGCWA